MYTIPDSSCASTKNISGRAFVHRQKTPIFRSVLFCAGTMLRCFGSSKRESSLSKTENQTETGVKNEERRLDSSGKVHATVLGHFCSHCTSWNIFSQGHAIQHSVDLVFRSLVSNNRVKE